MYHAHKFENAILLDVNSTKLIYIFNAFPIKSQQDLFFF